MLIGASGRLVEVYWRAARAKSCPFFGLAFYLGAVMGGASIETAAAIQKLGRLYGEMIQIHDDLSDCLSVSIGSDWIQKKATLPILFARIVDHPDRQKFMSLLELGTDSDSIRTAQEILLRCGAVSFCIDQIIQRHKIGMQILGELKLSDSQSFNQLFDGIVEPIWKLPGKWS
jgi:geranylgeranyl diphosphate synthase type I